ncbi:phage baseplate upper protein [Enterococcus faecalis]|nr:phage baseplate upper protein [Enterococcus faecalis]
MAHNKIGQLKVRTSVANKRDIETNYIFYSYDKGSAALEFWLKNQKGEMMNLTNVTVKLLFTAMQDNKERKFTYLDSQPIIENHEEGRIFYPLPDKLLNYEGEIKGYLYLDFENGSHSDELSFTFTVIRSKIDSDMEEISEVYIKDFEQVKKEVFELAEKTKQEISTIRPELEASVSQLTEQVETLGKKVEVNKTETNHLLQLIAEKELLTVKDFLVALSRGYFEFTRELTFDGKVVGSLVENPNIASAIASSRQETFEYPTPYKSLHEISAYPSAVNSLGYNALRGGPFYSSSTSGNKGNPYILYMRIQWNIVEDIQRWFGEKYFQGLSLEEQIKMVEKGLYSILPKNQAYGYHGTVEEGWSGKGSGLEASWYDNQTNTWEKYARNENKRFETLTATIIKNNTQQFLDNQGRVNILMVSDAGEYVSLYYNKATLEYTYRIYLTDILYYKRDPTIDRMQAQIQQLWDEVFKN